MKQKLVALAAAILGGNVAQPALAADFTFDVPVRLQNLAALNRVRASCMVWSVPPGVAPSRMQMIGSGEASAPVIGGNFDGTLTIGVNNSSTVPSAEARSYACNLYATGTSRTGVPFEAGYGAFQTSYETATGQSIERIVYRVGGPLP